MTSAITEMKKTLDANKHHIEKAIKATGEAPVTKAKVSGAKVVAQIVKAAEKAEPVAKVRQSAKPAPKKEAKPAAKKPAAKASKTTVAKKPQRAAKSGHVSSVKKFSDVYEKAVDPKPHMAPKEQKPEVTVRVEVSQKQILPWEDDNTTVSVQTPHVPETVVSRMVTPHKATQETVVERRRETISSQSSTAARKTSSSPQAVMGVLGTGFRPINPVIKR